MTSQELVRAINAEILHDKPLHAILEDVTSKIPHLLRQFTTDDRSTGEKKPLFTAEQIMDMAKADPTPNANYITWICKIAQRGQVRFPEDFDKVRETLADFHKLKHKLPQDKRDIYKIGSFAELAELMKPLTTVTIKGGAAKKFVVQPGMELVYDSMAKERIKNPDGSEGSQCGWRIYKVTTIEGAAIAGKTSKWGPMGERLETSTNATAWCTRAPEWGGNYLKQGPLWVVLVSQDGGQIYEPFAQLHFESNQFCDRNDDPDLPEKYKFRIIAIIAPYSGYKIEDDPQLAYSYAEFNDARFPKGEAAILRHPSVGNLVGYAEYFIKGRWPEAESRILTDIPEAVMYAQAVIKGRWPELEALLVKGDLSALMRYAVDVVAVSGERWPAGEKVILSKGSPTQLVQYAKEVIKGRWPEAELRINADVTARQAYDAFAGKLPPAAPAGAKAAKAPAKSKAKPKSKSPL
jgi:hypothetical protein